MSETRERYTTPNSEEETDVNIVQVGIGRTVSLGNYESLRLDARAEVADGAPAAEALAEAEAWLDEQIALRTGQKLERTVDRLHVEETRLHRKIAEYRRGLELMQQAWAAARGLLEKHGVPLPDEIRVPDDIPF